MKFIAAILLLAVAMSPALAYEGSNTLLHRILFNNGGTRDLLGDKLKNFLEQLKETLKTGDPSLGIPVLDPLNVDQKSFSIDQDQAKLELGTKSVHVAGLAEYSVDAASFALAGLKISVGLSWSNVNVSSRYDVNGSVLTVPVYGSGEVIALTNKFSLVVTTGLKVKNGKLTIGSLSSKVSLDTLRFVITGLYNDDDLSLLVSTVITDMAPELLRDFQNDITSIANNIAQKYANEILANFSLSDLISLLG